VSRFLVTGAGGFIGSAIVRRLTEEGHEAVAFRGDLLSVGPSDLASARATHCIHAAWYTNHADYLTHDINRSWMSASLKLADLFADAGGERFVGIGTCLEYDVARADGPCSEDTTPLGPHNIYARSKLDLFEALQCRGGNFAWARVFFVYGPRDRPGRLVPNMIEEFSRGREAGPKCGALRRDYIHVDDLAGQLVNIALSDCFGAVNTGTGLAPTLSEIFVAGAQAFGRPELARVNGETDGQPLIIQADMSRFRRVVGDPGARDVEAGLRDLIS
jgi:nucleoside-diphosphate-sugar epimerase